MAFHTFGPGLALDEVTGRGIPAVVAQLVDAETGDPVQAYTMDDEPIETTVSTNRYGYFGQFQVPETVRRLRLTFGGMTLERTAWELLTEAAAAAEQAKDDAELARIAAELASTLVDAPADEIIAGLIQQEGSQTQAAGDGRYLQPANVDAAVAGLIQQADSETRAQLEGGFGGRNIRAAEPPALPAGMTGYAWAGEPNASESVKTVDGVETERNYCTNPRPIGLDGWAWTSTAVVASVIQDGQPAVKVAPDAPNQNVYYAWGPYVPAQDAKWFAISAEVYPLDSWAAEKFRFVFGGVNGNTTPQTVVSRPVPQGAFTRVTASVLVQGGTGDLRAQYWPGNTTEFITKEGFLIRRTISAYGDTQSEAEANVAAYFDGDTPSDTSEIIWINDTTDVAHTWDGAQWAPIQTTPGKVSLSEFGAAGDGITDDADAFLAFVNYLNDNNLDGFIPHGTYRLGKIASLPVGMSDVKIEGESKHGTKLVFAPTGTPSSATVFPCIGPTRVTFAHMTIDGGMDQHGVRGHGISWRNAEDCHVIDVHVRNHGHSAVMMFANNEDAGIYGRNTMRDTDCDGMNDANNGFLFVNMDSCEYINVTARNGGMSETHSPSCAIQFKNLCTNSRAVNANSYGWKSGLTMGGDTPELGSLNCTMQGASYGCNYATLIGKSTYNYVDVQSVGSLVRAVHFAQDATENVVDVVLADVPAGQIPISQGFHKNTVNVRYMPAGIAKLVEIGPSVDYTKTLIMAHPGSPLNAKLLTQDNSGKTTNRVAALDSLFDFGAVNPIVKFPTSDDKQNWITYSPAANYMAVRVDGADRLIIRPSSLASGGTNTASLGLGSNGWQALYLAQPNGTVRKLSVNDSGQLVVE